MGEETKKSAGYQYLLAYKITVPIYDYTVEFCQRCSPFYRSRPPLPPDRTYHPYLPNVPYSSSSSPPDLPDQSAPPISPHFPPLSSPRTLDQMVQAARSGMTNIPEGAKQESLAGYIKLVGVSRGSLEELLKDYFSYARQHHIEIWGKDWMRGDPPSHEATAGTVGVIWEIIRKTPILPDTPDFPDLPYLPERAVNLMITILHQATYLIDKLKVSLEEKHTREGGFSENLLKKRLEFRKRSGRSGG